MADFWIVPALLAVAWFWLDSMRAHEWAMTVARRACAEHDLQLLDETVVLTRLRLGRDGDGHVAWKRRYGFEFSNEGDNRSNGVVELLGRRVIDLHLEMGPFTLHEGESSREHLLH